MLSFALDGITSFTVRPIRFVTAAGFGLFAASLLAGGYTLVSKLTGNAVSGWSSLMLSIWFIGGAQLLALGMIGEYIGKMYMEVKQRPRYLIDKELLRAAGAPAAERGLADEEANIS
jgi:glycosyltransferase involved in cell wall biosynthesis